jgi:hypothetical protein
MLNDTFHLSRMNCQASDLLLDIVERNQLFRAQVFSVQILDGFRPF